jgi:hypothetical protein
MITEKSHYKEVIYTAAFVGDMDITVSEWRIASRNTAYMRNEIFGNDRLSMSLDTSGIAYV